MSRRVYRAAVPADGKGHVMGLRGPIVHVATRGEDGVEIWYIDDLTADAVTRVFCVVGTGQPIPPILATHVGTAVTPSGTYVWHLFECDPTYRNGAAA